MTYRSICKTWSIELSELKPPKILNKVCEAYKRLLLVRDRNTCIHACQGDSVQWAIAFNIYTGEGEKNRGFHMGQGQNTGIPKGNEPEKWGIL